MQMLVRFVDVVAIECTRWDDHLLPVLPTPNRTLAVRLRGITPAHHPLGAPRS
jgi:hypothetical protein